MDPVRGHASEPTLVLRRARGPAAAEVLAALGAGAGRGDDLGAWGTRVGWPGALVLWLGDVSADAADPTAAAILFTDGVRAALTAVEEAHPAVATGLCERLAREAVDVARAAGCRCLEVSVEVVERLGPDGLRRLGCEPGGPEGTWRAQL